MQRAAPGAGRSALDRASADRVRLDGSDKTVIVTGCRAPDGVAVDIKAGYVYWTNMGIPPIDDGSIERVDLDGSNRVTIVPNGATFTPKQLQLDLAA
jgi:hypothetical protein